jgi:hypothetical protein
VSGRRGRARAALALLAGLLLALALGVAVAPAALEGRGVPAVLQEDSRGDGAAGAGAARDLPRDATVPAPAPAPDPAPAPAPAGPAASAPTPRAARTPPPPLTDAAAVARARRFASGRRGTVAFAVLEPSGRLRGRARTRSFRSASVSKAMLLVALLRRAKGRDLTPAERAIARPMVTASDNDAADLAFAQVGDAGLLEVARAARMKRFTAVGGWSEAGLTPADQARFFLRVDRLVPARHRRYLRSLLSGIVPAQRWGVPEAVARRPGAAVLFKGGWRPGLTHQAARVERGGRRLGLVVMIEGGPSMPYDEDTIAGIARRVLIPAPVG